MINFIICDDEKSFSSSIQETIFKYLMNYDIDYKTYKFNDYDNKFEEIVKKDIGFKVYLLDIETKNGSGLDAARLIREEYDDWTSIIILITSHEEYRYKALGARLQLMDFINKLDNYEHYLIEDLVRCLKNYNNRPKCLKIKHHNVFNLIEYKHIICIEKEPDSKRCIIKTTYGNKVYHGTLSDVYKELDDKRFLKVHRSLIVNVDYVDEYDVNENKLTFKDGTFTYLISRNNKKELIEYVNTNS